MALRIGVVGLGLAGSTMIPAIRSHPGFELVGAVDTGAEVRERFRDAEGLPVFSDLGELLDRPGLDVVYIATPHEYHADQTIAAASAGKHVIVEKPMALRIEDAEGMARAARRHDVRLVVGHTHGFDPAVSVMADLVAAETYGPVGMVSMWNFTNFLYRPRRPEELDTGRGGGILYNQVPHQVDIFCTVVPDPVVSVRAAAGRLDAGRPTEGHCAATLQTRGGVVGNLVYSGYDQFDTDELHGWIGESGRSRSPAHGAARRALRRLAPAAELRRRADLGYGRSVPAPAGHPHFGELVVTCARADLRYGRRGVVVYGEDGVRELAAPERAWRPGHGDVLAELHAAVTRDLPPVHDAEFGLESLRVCLAVAESAARRREVRPREIAAVR